MKSLAKHILFFSLVVLLACPGVHASDLTNEDIQKYKAPMAGDHSDLEAMAETFQKSGKDPDDYKQFKRKESELREIYEKYYGKIDTPEPEPKKEQVQCDNPVKVDYYFSFSMPESSIQAAVADALALHKQCVKVTMRLRGLVDNNLKKTILVFYNIAKANPEDLPIEIDPKGFKENNIQHVPTILVNGKRYVGDMRLAGIMSSQETIKEGTLAVSYPVKEEDIVEMFKRKAPIMEQKMREYIASGAVRKKFNLTRYDGKFKKAEEERVYYIDPTYTVPEDIRDHNGTVIAKAGQKFNPLDTVSIGKYIFIDGNKAEDVELAVKGNYRKIILMSGDVIELSKQYRIPFYHVNDELIQLFQIKRVPLLIEQEGRLIRATEKPT